MSDETRRIRVEIGPFSVILEGYQDSSEGVELAIQLIRNLPEYNQSQVTVQQIGSAETGETPHRPLLLQEQHLGQPFGAAPEFHTKRLDGPPDALRPRWLSRIARLESSGQRAIKTLTGGQNKAEAPPETQEANPPPESPPDPETAEADRFSPRVIANADIRPGDPGADPARTIRDGMDINRRAIEQATAERTRARGPSTDPGHDYLAMEDKAIDRLLETTNALLEADDHARRNQSLHRLKAAVAATEAERKISVKTATGTVTLDFDEKPGTRQPVADLLAAPTVDPEKRRQRLQEYRNMIAGQKKRP